MTISIFQPDLVKFPHRPGCYLMYDKSGKVIYVGKAVDLRKRIASYWNKTDQSVPPGRRPSWAGGKTSKLLEKVAKLDFMVTDSEVEALILENELIKKHTPQFNVLLRDDKNYQYIKIDLNKDFPVVEVVRAPRDAKAWRPQTKMKYFGPYTKSVAVKQTLQLINKIFPICAKSEELNKKITREPCLNFHLSRCLGPCIGKIGDKEYQRVISDVVEFLSGRDRHVLKYLEARMQALSQQKKFEEALRLRDQIKSVEIILERQKVAQPRELYNQDFWGQLVLDDRLVATILKVRNGRLIDQQTFALTLPPGLTRTEILSEAIQSVYGTVKENLPSELIVDELPTNVETLVEWLRKRAGKSVKITVPQKGIKKRLLLMARKNVTEHASAFSNANLCIQPALLGLKKLLYLKRISRIEAYDISHLGGTATVGSMVVFLDGKPAKSQYRRFRIKTVRGIDDYASLGEMIYRRLRPRRLADKRFATNLPDLILIDGGKGQLSTVAKQVHQMNVLEIPIISLAKREEEIFTLTKKQSIKLSPTTPELQLLQRVRDEAHRFAITYQAVLHSRQIKSIGIRGVGEATRKKIVRAFGSLSAARQVSLVELQKVVGKKAHLIKKNS